MKKLGALLIICACLLYCVKYIRAQRSRLRELEEIATLLETMGAELGQRLTPLPELVSLMKGRTTGPTSGFLCELESGLPRLGEESFSYIWSRCVSDSFPLLDEPELRAVGELGACLGRFDIEAQLRAIDDCTVLLRERVQLLRREQRDKRRVHMGLACAGGAMLVIVLI